MRLLVAVILALTFCLSFQGAGAVSTKPASRPAVVHTTTTPHQHSRPKYTKKQLSAFRRYIIGYRHYMLGLWLAALQPHYTTVGDGVPCDGDLTPCWRVMIESKGTWNAYNPTGCSGTGCYGPYQFGGFWAGKLGLPGNLFYATHDQWVNADRQLWANGSGCSNWDAC